MKLRQPGVSGNICVHKYFYERNPIWQQILTEEKEAISKEQVKDDEVDSEDDDDQEETKTFAPVHFDPMDSRHLSSLPVLRARLAKLLKNCPHQMHTSNNLMVRIVSGLGLSLSRDDTEYIAGLRESSEVGPEVLPHSH